MLILLVAVILFHLSIILKIVPYEFTWGGLLKLDAEMYIFETVSILINLFLGTILMVKGHYLRPILPAQVVRVILSAFLVLFSLNTVGNLLAKTTFEKLLSLFTLVSAVLLWMVLRRTKDAKSTHSQ